MCGATSTRVRPGSDLIGSWRTTHCRGHRYPHGTPGAHPVHPGQDLPAICDPEEVYVCQGGSTLLTSRPPRIPPPVSGSSNLGVSPGSWTEGREGVKEQLLVLLFPARSPKSTVSALRLQQPPLSMLLLDRTKAKRRGEKEEEKGAAEAAGGEDDEDNS